MTTTYFIRRILCRGKTMSQKDKTQDDLQNIQTILMLIRSNFEKLEERLASLETLMKKDLSPELSKKMLDKNKKY